VTGLLDRLIGALVSGTSAQRAIDATLADWRHERAEAATALQRVTIDGRSTAALLRTLARAGVSEFPAALRSSLPIRLAMVAAVWMAWTIWYNGLPGDQRFFLVAPSAKAWLLAASAMTVRVAGIFPILVFVAEASGRRNRATPTLGSLMLLVSALMLLTMFIMPAGQLFSRYESWRYFANASQPAPDLRAAGILVPSVFAAFVTAASLVVLFVLANGIRRVGGFVGWFIGTGPALGFVAVLAVLRLVVTSAEGRVAVMILSPVAITALLIWSAVKLARIAAERQASAPSSPQIAK
jgi:hypothetical protein